MKDCEVGLDKVTKANEEALFLLWIIVDGVGLAIIAACTLFDGYHEWRDTFQYHYEENYQCLTLWLVGRITQVVALVSLMIYAASLNSFPILEVLGMSMLTAGPMMCISASLLFDTEHDPSLGDHFGIEWFLEEALELAGILFLDLSYRKMSNELELLAEVVGFVLLGCAALCDFSFPEQGAWLPGVSYRFDMVHSSDAFGLLLLTMVSFADYRVRVREDERELRLIGAANKKKHSCANSANGSSEGHPHEGIGYLENGKASRLSISSPHSSPQLSAWREPALGLEQFHAS